MDTAKTLQTAILYFSEFENCRKFMTELRWPDGKVACPVCGAEKVTFLAKTRVWKCYAGHLTPTFSLKTGTIFEDSPIALEKWLPAAWIVINAKNGISSYEVHRALGVTQKTAWFMLHRVRLAMQDGNFNKLGGEVEVDETFIGGKARNMHAARRRASDVQGPTKGKTIALGILERGGKIRTAVIPNRTKMVMQGHVRANVEVGS